VDAYLPAFVVGDPTELVVRTPMELEISDLLDESSEVRLYLAKEDEKSFTVSYLPNFLPVTTVEAPESSSLFGSSSTEYFYFTLPEGLSAEEAKVGRSVNLVVVLGRKEDALLLPPAAIREYRGLSFVIVQDGETRRRVEINEIGLKSTDLWEVIGDLREGDQVLGP
jgi:hypothetical protein